MNAMQTELLERLRSAVQSKSPRRIVYSSEWLGYLPYGAYHWITCDGKDISISLPCDWSNLDLEALENAGLLVKIEERRDPTEEYNTTITYDVT